MPEQQPFANITIERVSAELGSLHLIIIDLRAQLAKLVSIPGVTEAILAYEKAQGNGVVKNFEVEKV